MALGTLALVAAPINGGNSASEPLFNEEVSLVGDAAYPTGGTSGLQAAYQALGLAQSMRTIVGVQPIDCKGYIPAWDSTNGKLKFYQIGALDGNAANAGPLTEVANATDLHAVTFKLLITSR